MPMENNITDNTSANISIVYIVNRILSFQAMHCLKGHDLSTDRKFLTMRDYCRGLRPGNFIKIQGMQKE